MNPATDELGAEEISKQPIVRLLERLATKPAGLDDTEVQLRLNTFGPNDAADVKRSPLWLQFLSRFRNPLVIILLVASGLSAATGDVASFVIVVTIVTISMTIDFVQEVRAQNAVEALRRSVAVQATVRRNGVRRLDTDRSTGARRHCRADRRRSRSCGLAAARKPRSFHQPGAPDRRAVPRREARQRRRLPALKIPPERRTPSLPAPPSSAAPQLLSSAGPAARRRSAILRRAWPKSRPPPPLRSAFVALAC